MINCLQIILSLAFTVLMLREFYIVEKKVKVPVSKDRGDYGCNNRLLFSCSLITNESVLKNLSTLLCSQTGKNSLT